MPGHPSSIHSSPPTHEWQETTTNERQSEDSDELLIHSTFAASFASFHNFPSSRGPPAIHPCDVMRVHNCATTVSVLADHRGRENVPSAYKMFYSKGCLGADRSATPRSRESMRHIHLAAHIIRWKSERTARIFPEQCVSGIFKRISTP